MLCSCSERKFYFIYIKIFLNQIFDAAKIACVARVTLCSVFYSLLYLSVSTRPVIGQFCWSYYFFFFFGGSYVTVLYGPLTLKVSFPARPINLRDIINILVTNLVFSVRTVSYGSSSFYR